MLTNVNYVTVTELMKRWRCSRPTVLRYLRKFDVRFVQLGKKPLVPEDEVTRIENLMTTNSDI